MAGPITWQNVGQPNFGDAANFMQLSMEGANKAFTNAGNRAKEQENLAKAAKTNSILSKINGITDEDTLRAFQDTIDFEDMGVDSNAIMDTLSSQSDRIQGRRVDAANISNIEQDIAASKANVTLNQNQFDQTVATDAFNQAAETTRLGLAQAQDARDATRSTLENTGLKQQNDLGQIELDNLARQEKFRVNAGKAVIARAQGATPEQAFAMVVDPNDPVGTVAAMKQVDDSLYDIRSMTKAQQDDMDKTTQLYDGQIAKTTTLLERATEKFDRANPVVPPDTVTAADELNGTKITKTQIIDDWLGAIEKSNPEDVAKFRDQGDFLSTAGNRGYTELKEQVNDPKSPLNLEYRTALIAKAKEKELEIDIDKIPPIDAALLKQALGSVSFEGNIIQDGIDVEKLVKAAVEAQATRITRQNYDKRREEAIGGVRDELFKLSNKKSQALRDIDAGYKNANITSFQNAVRQPEGRQFTGNISVPTKGYTAAIQDLNLNE